MPHFGLMDADALGPARAALERARLHMRSGRRRLREGKVSYGIITVYDALAQAMLWHLEEQGLREKLDIRAGEDLRDERTVYKVLTRSGVLDGSFDFDAFLMLVDEALEFRLEGFDYSGTMKGLEYVMERLGVTPFEEAALPPEKPGEF